MRVNHPSKAVKQSPSAETRLIFIVRHLDRKMPDTNKTAHQGKGRRHNLPLGWRLVNGNVAIFRNDTTKLKKIIHPHFVINIVRWHVLLTLSIDTERWWRLCLICWRINFFSHASISNTLFWKKHLQNFILIFLHWQRWVPRISANQNTRFSPRFCLLEPLY